MTIYGWRQFLISLLQDEHGITDSAYYKLVRLIESQCSDSGELSDILTATCFSEDCRVRLPKDWVDKA